MSQALEDYYESELAVLGGLMRDFARRYPAEAGRLLPDPDRPADPHLDRFVEGFALLTGRLQHKLDSEFPELSEALLHVLYPHLLAPVPSLSIAQFGLDAPADERVRNGIVIPRQTRLRTRPLGTPPLATSWQTGYTVDLWPVKLTRAQVLRRFFPPALPVPPRTVAALVLEFECQGPWRFADLPLEKLRYYLSGDRQVIANLYEVLFNHTLQVVFHCLDAKRELIVLPAAECLGPVGFEPDEGLLPLPRESFLGNRILTEFLSFREKFLFLDLAGWQRAAQAGFGTKTQVVFFLNRAEDNLEQGVSAQTLLAGCTPIINLFEKSAEPLAITHKTTEYRVVPARTQPMGMEVYSIDHVTAFDPARRQSIDFHPFYDTAPNAGAGHAFWYSSRRSSYLAEDRGTEVYLTLVDSEFNPRLPAEGVLHIKTTCSNRDWPIRFQRGGEALFLVGGAAAPGPIVCLHQPTMPLRPGLRRSTYWRLLAHNNLNHVSFTDPQGGLRALQEIVRLCDCSDLRVVPHLATVNQQIIEGITGLTCRPVLGRVTQAGQTAYCRGQEVTLEFDERKFVGVGLYLFSCVLERFLGLYAGLNSFSQLVAKTKQAEGYFKKWPPRAAHQQLQ